MRCSTAKRYINLQLDNELKAKHQHSLDRHLAKCSACRAWQAEELKLHAMLSAKPAPELPSWVHARIMDSVHHLDTKRPAFAHKLRLATAGAAIAVIVSTWAGVQIGIKSFHHSPNNRNNSISTFSTYFGENTIMENYLLIGDNYE